MAIFNRGDRTHEPHDTRDPHGTQANESDYLIISLVHDTLTVPGAEPNTVPRLAANWQASDDLKTWRFTLAEGAKFHDGTPVTAADVVWSLKRLRNTPAGASRLPGIRPGNIKAEGDDILSGSFVAAGSGRFQATKVGADSYAAKLAKEARQFQLTRSELMEGINTILRIITWVLIPVCALLLWSQLRNHSLDTALRSTVAGAVAMVPEGSVGYAYTP